MHVRFCAPQSFTKDSPPMSARHNMSQIADRARQSFDSDAIERYHRVRQDTERLAGALSAEDQCVQSMPDASPTKWHRAHTTWFFEEFLLRQFMPDYSP